MTVRPSSGASAPAQRGRADGPGGTASFSEPGGLCLLPDHVAEVAGYDLVVADTVNHLLRGIDLRTNEVTTVAGTGNQWRSTVDLMPHDALAVDLSSPWDLAWYDDKVIVAMAGIHQLWWFDPIRRTAGVYAGTTVEALRDGPLDQVWMAQPSGLSVSADGDDALDRRLRIVRAPLHSRRPDAHRRRPGPVRLRPRGRPGHRGSFPASARVSVRSPTGPSSSPTPTTARYAAYDPTTDVGVHCGDRTRRAQRRRGSDRAARSSSSSPRRTASPDWPECRRSGRRHHGDRGPAPHRAAAEPTGTRRGDARGHLHAGARPEARRVLRAVDAAGGFRFAPRAAHSRERAPAPICPGRLVISSDVERGVLQVVAQAATCDADAEHAACHLTRQDWGVPIVVTPDGAARLPLILRGLDESP